METSSRKVAYFLCAYVTKNYTNISALITLKAVGTLPIFFVGIKNKVLKFIKKFSGLLINLLILHTVLQFTNEVKHFLNFCKLYSSPSMTEWDF